MNPDPKSISVERIARLVGGKARGEVGRLLIGVQTLDEAGPRELSWLGSSKYLKKLGTTKAGAILTSEAMEVPEDFTIIKVADPDLALCRVLEYFNPGTPEIPPGVHPTALAHPTAEISGAAIGAYVVVDRGARIGAGTQLHAGVFVGAETEIGRDCTLWPNVVVRERCQLGDRVIIHPNTTIGADGYGYLQRGGRHVKIPQIGRVIIEDDVEIGANCCVDRARSGQTRIRRGTKIDNLVQIAHNCDIGEDCIIIGQCGISGSTRLGHHVVLAGQVGVIDHREIGAGTVVAAQSGITGDVPSGKVYRGTPAIENTEFGRQQVHLRRLPKMAEQLKELAKRVERLESATADNSKRD